MNVSAQLAALQLLVAPGWPMRLATDYSGYSRKSLSNRWDRLSFILYSNSPNSFTSSVKWLRSSTQSVKRLHFLLEEIKKKILDLPPFLEGRTGLIELSLTFFLPCIPLVNNQKSDFQSTPTGLTELSGIILSIHQSCLNWINSPISHNSSGHAFSS